MIATDKQIAVVGLGLTGLSYARYLKQQGLKFVLMDTREEPPMLLQFKQEFAGDNCLQALYLGGLDLASLLAADKILLSPGFPLDNEMLHQAKAAGVKIQGDIALFAEVVAAPVVAVTGSNAKSTVVSLLGAMAEADGKQVAVAGNIGQPVLDLLQQPKKQLYILELSSFQLEVTDNLCADVACVLNVSEDHLDRYRDMAHYHAVKHKVYYGAKHVVSNRLAPLTQAPIAEGVSESSFGLNRPDFKQFGLLSESEEEFIAYQFQPLMSVRELALKGRHNIENALAALAIGHAAGLSIDAMLDCLRDFKGLPHRCETVACLAGVEFINDSKATNVGATLAAIKGYGNGRRNIVLIAGGVAKGADFSSLASVVESIKAVVLIGADRKQLLPAFNGCDIAMAGTMAEAVASAAAYAVKDDIVLLSPACASLDMYKNFEQRGLAFATAVNVLPQQEVAHD